MRNFFVKVRRIVSIHKHDEQGNLIVSLIIILVISTIAAALAYRVIGNEGTVVTRQNAAAGVSKGDAGISDALFRLDQGTTGTGGGTFFCVNAVDPSDANCVGGTVPGAPNVSYVATQVTSTNWLIKSVGQVNGQEGAVQESAIRTAMYPFAVFGNTALNFNGNAGTSLSTYDPSRPASGSNPNMDGAVAIGSNGTITCDGGIGANVQADYYGTGGVGSLSASCGTPQSFSDTFNLPIPAAPTSPTPNACPGDGNIGSTSSSGLSVLAAGTYLCTTPITISGLLMVSGQVQLYVILDSGTYGSSTNAVTIIRGSYINDMSDYCANNTDTTNCVGTQNLPTALNFQLFSNSNGTFGNDNGQGYYFGGIMYAPEASLTQDGCKSQYYGSITINLLTCNGGPHLYVSYDSELSTDYGPWTASAYQQINPSSVSIP